MKQQFIMFLENYTGASGTIYKKDVKYKIKSIKNNYIYLSLSGDSEDKVSEFLKDKLYVVGNIEINN